MRFTFAPFACLFFTAVAASGAIAADEIEINLRQFEQGQLLTAQTSQGVIWIIYRTDMALATIDAARQYPIVGADPSPSRNKYRSIERKYFVVYPACPKFMELPHYDQTTGFTCISAGTKYDLTGRPLSNSDGATPMRVPVYRFKDQYTIVLPTK